MAGRSYVEVRWLDPEALSYDVHTQLAGGALTLHAGGRRLPSLPPIHMLLRHDPVFIQCEASPVDMKATSATYRLNLNGSQVAELRKFARPLSNEISVSVEQKRRR